MLLVLLVLVDIGLMIVFLWAIAVYNCHGGYECPI
jgi:hypothetical protein